MSSTDNFDEAGFALLVGERRVAPTPLRAAMWTVYATTLVLVLLMPHSVASWLDDLPTGPVVGPFVDPLVGLARTCLEPVARLSDRLGLQDLHGAARRRTEALSRRAQ